VAYKSYSFVAVACFLPGQAKDLLTPRYILRRTPPERWIRSRELWQHAKLTRDRNSSSQQDSNPHSQL